MGLFNKKDKVPQIPPAPELPELPKTPPKEEFAIPSIADNLGENPELRKSVGSWPSEEKGVKHEELPHDFHFKPEQSLIPSKPHEEKRRTLELSPSITERKTIQAEPIFVRIDKFQAAQKEFENIKKQIKNIETILKKVKETRLKEEAEISNWSGELEKIKAQLSEIDSDIFNKI